MAAQRTIFLCDRSVPPSTACVDKRSTLGGTQGRTRTFPIRSLSKGGLVFRERSCVEGWPWATRKARCKWPCTHSRFREYQAGPASELRLHGKNLSKTKHRADACCPTFDREDMFKLRPGALDAHSCSARQYSLQRILPCVRVRASHFWQQNDDSISVEIP